MSTRRPLGASLAANIPVSSDRLGLVEGNVGCDNGTFGKHSTVRTKKSIAELRQDLDRAKSRLQKSDHPKLHNIPSERNVNEDLEARLQDLIRQHNQSKAKHTAEMDALKAANIELKSSRDQARSELRTIQSENTRLEHNLKSQNTIASSSSSAAARHLEEKQEWHRERRELNRDINQLRTELDKLRSLTAELESAAEERDTLEETLDITVKAYGRRYMTAVPRKEYQRLQFENEKMRIQASRQREVKFALMLELKDSVDTVEILQERLDDARSEVQEAQTAAQDLLEQRRLDREHSYPVRPQDDTVTILDHATDEQTGLVDLCLSHSDLSTLNGQVQYRNLLVVHRNLFMSADEASNTHTSTRASLTSLQRAHAQLEHSHKGLQTAHAPCENLVNALNGEITRWQQSEKKVADELIEVKGELKKMEEKSKGDRESLKRANDSAMRRQAAEDALEEEISALRAALEEANEYRDTYENLLEEYRVMSERELLAHEEVERLGTQNAELIGHTNGDQKISYVESVRREMAMTKHELATTRHLLNKAQDRINTLSQEVESYRSVDNAMNLGASTRTRIVRRVPEGTWLGKSVRGRSVSGPSGR